MTMRGNRRDTDERLGSPVATILKYSIITVHSVYVWLAHNPVQCTVRTQLSVIAVPQRWQYRDTRTNILTVPIKAKFR